MQNYMSPFSKEANCFPKEVISRRVSDIVPQQILFCCGLSLETGGLSLESGGLSLERDATTFNLVISLAAIVHT